MNYKDKYILFYLEGKKALSEKRVSRILGISSPDDMPDGYHGQDPRIWVYIKYKRQNKMFRFRKTFCSDFSIINTKQNVHFATKKIEIVY